MNTYQYTIRITLILLSTLLSTIGISQAESSSFIEQPIDIFSLSPIAVEKCNEVANIIDKKKRSRAKVLSEKAQTMLSPVLKIVEAMQNAETEELKAKNNIKQLNELMATWAEAVKAKLPEETDEQFLNRQKELEAQRKSALKQINRSQDRIEKAKREYDELVVTGLPKLRSMQTKSDGIKSYDRAIMWNYFAYFAGVTEDYPLAKEAFTYLLQEEGATGSLRKNALWQLGILELQDEKFEEGYTHLSKWYSLAKQEGDKLRPDMYFLLSRSAFSAEKFEASESHLMNAFTLNSCNGKLPIENWLTSLFDLKSSAEDVEGSLRPLELLLILFPKKRYWLRLQSLYAQSEKTTKQTAVLEIAYQQGFFDKEREYKALTTSLIARNLPYKASEVMQNGVNLGIVEKNFDNYKLLADAYRQASEYDNAIKAYIKADAFTDNGILLKTIASTYLIVGDNENALKYYRKAAEKGGLRQEKFVNLQIGTTLFQLERTEEALEYFESLMAKYEKANDTREIAKVKPWIIATNARLEYIANHKDRIVKFQEEFDRLRAENPYVDFSKLTAN